MCLGWVCWKIEILKTGNQELKSEDNCTFYQQPHNDFLWILSEQGLIGIIFYLAFVFVIYLYLFRIIRRTKDKSDRLYFLLMFFGFTGYFTYSFLSFPKERIEHIVYLTFMIAPVIGYHDHLKKNKQIAKQPNNNKAVIMFFILILIITFLIGIIRLKSEIHTKNAYLARENQKWDLVVSEIKKAESFLYKIDPISTPIMWYSGLANFNMGRTEDAFYDFKKSFEANPYHIHAINNLGTCYEIMNNHSQAIDLFKKAIQIAPNFDDALMNLAAVYFNTGMVDSAYNTFCKIVPDTLNYKYKHFLLVIVKGKINELTNKETDEQKKSFYKNVASSEVWMTNIHMKTIAENRTFEEQLVLDYKWIVEN